MHAGLRTETSALRDVVGAMVGRMDQLVDCQNALQRQVHILNAGAGAVCSAVRMVCHALQRFQQQKQVVVRDVKGT